MELYDRSGQAQWPPWAEQTFGISIERTTIVPRFKLQILMERGPSLVSVYGDAGPIENATVIFHCAEHRRFIVQTDASGHCNFQMDPGRYDVWIMHDEYESDCVRDMPIGGDRKLRAIFYLSGQTPPGPEPPPEEPEEPMTEVKVYDRNGHEKDEAWAKAEYGTKYRRANVSAGQKVFRLVEWREKSGNSSLITKVIDEDGNPMSNMDVAFYWSGAPDPPDPPTDVRPQDWHRNFIRGPTNVNGDVGPGMGRGAYKGRGECGPHSTWVRHPTIPSDISECHGMIAGTPHDHLDQKFQLMVAGEDPEEPNGGDGEMLEFVEKLVFEGVQSSMLGIAYPAKASYDTRGDFQGPGVDDVLSPDGWEHGGTTMALVEGCTDFSGSENREYSIAVFDMASHENIAGPDAETFGPIGTPRKRVIYVYKEGDDGGDPGNGDEPDSGNGDEPTTPGVLDVNINVEVGPLLFEALLRFADCLLAVPAVVVGEVEEPQISTSWWRKLLGR